MSTTAFSHLGVCTSDLERSQRFYTEALGFTPQNKLENVGGPYDTLLEMPGVTFSAHYLQCGNLLLELIGYDNREIIGEAKAKPMNQLGFTHITLQTEALEAVCKKVSSMAAKYWSKAVWNRPMGPWCSALTRTARESS